MDKPIFINGTQNRYKIKRLTKTPSINKLELDINSQDTFIHDRKNVRERKLANYKQQDLKKGREFNINYENVVCKMEQQELKCRYCLSEMLLDYESRRDREMRQWTLDRINNDLGHTDMNCHLACLKCNLQRRRTSDDAFLFTKQFVIKRI